MKSSWKRQRQATKYKTIDKYQKLKNFAINFGKSAEGIAAAFIKLAQGLSNAFKDIMTAAQKQVEQMTPEEIIERLEKQK